MANPFVIDSLIAVGFVLDQDAKSEMKSISLFRFSEIVDWLLIQINICRSIESCVNKLDHDSTKEARNHFIEELNSALSEMSLPLLPTENEPNQEQKMITLTHLLGELFAVRLLDDEYEEDNVGGDQSMICDDEINELYLIRSILDTLNLNNLSSDPKLTIDLLFHSIDLKLIDLIKHGQLSNDQSALLKTVKSMSDRQWKAMEQLEKQLVHEYEIRKRTMITRVLCTIDAFRWRSVTKETGKTSASSERVDRVCQITKLHQHAKQSLQSFVRVELANVIAARISELEQLVACKVSQSHEICTIEPPANSGIANSGRMQRLSLHKLIIGQVPDRGGRPNEAPPPTKETFGQQQKNRSASGSGRGGISNSNARGGGFNRNATTANRIQCGGWNGGRESYQARQIHQQHLHRALNTCDTMEQDGYQGSGPRWPGDNRHPKRGRRGYHQGAGHYNY